MFAEIIIINGEITIILVNTLINIIIFLYGEDMLMVNSLIVTQAI